MKHQKHSYNTTTIKVKCLLPNAVLRMRIIETKSPNLRVPSFLKYLEVKNIKVLSTTNNEHDYDKKL